MSEAVVQRIKILSEIKDPFGRIPNIVIDFYGPGMGQSGWLYTLLTRFKNQDSSETFVSMKTLALTGGVTEKTIKSWAEHLKTLGVIKIIKDETYAQEKRRAAPNTYILILPAFPPPPELVEQFYPPEWTPPERAIKALKNISNFITLDTRPQEDEVGGVVGEKITPTPKPQDTIEPPLGEISTPSGGNSSPYKGKNLPPNKTLLSSSTEKETTTSSAVVEAFLNLSFETFKQKDPALTTTEMEEFYFKCLNLKGDNEEEAKEYLSEKIKVVLQLKKTADPKAVLWKAILGNWKPRNEPIKRSRTDEFDNFKKMQEENRKIDEENKESRIKRNGMPVEEIINIFKTYPAVMEFDRRLRILSSFFAENPGLEKALEIIKKAGEESGA